MTTREKVAITISKVLKATYSICYTILDEESGTEWLIACSRWEQSAWLSAYCGPVGFAIQVCDQDANQLADDVTDEIERITAKWREKGKCRQEQP